MLVSFKWTQAGRRGSRISKQAPVARTLLTGLTLTAAAAVRLATDPTANTLVVSVNAGGLADSAAFTQKRRFETTWVRGVRRSR